MILVGTYFNNLFICISLKGFKVLASASHYWPLEDVDGIHEFRDTNGGRQRTH